MARAKNTDRADARRRYKEQQRVVEPNTLAEDATAPAPEEPARRSLFQMPDLAADLRIVPGMIRARPLILAPFLLLFLAFIIVLLFAFETLPEGVVSQVAVLYAQLVWPFPPLVMFFIAGFLAPRASWLVGAILGAFYGVLIFLVNVLAPGGSQDVTTSATGAVSESIFFIAVLSIVFGALVGAFASWYRNFLRSSQERARANRMAREKEAAAKAKEQARLDREAQRKATAASRTTSSPSTTSAPRSK